MVIALAADWRWRSHVISGSRRKMRHFALPEVSRGTIPGAGGTQRLATVIGMGRALDMVLSAERIDADEALRIGLITRLTARHELLEQIDN
jgi:enoyl-CoA hydratase/carnithine racemase